MSRVRTRALILLCLGIFAGAALMASRPRVLPRPLGRGKSHSFTDLRPRGRSRIDAIASEDVDRIPAEHVASGPAFTARRPRPSPGRDRPEVLPLLGPRAPRPVPSSGTRLTTHLRC